MTRRELIEQADTANRHLHELRVALRQPGENPAVGRLALELLDDAIELEEKVTVWRAENAAVLERSMREARDRHWPEGAGR